MTGGASECLSGGRSCFSMRSVIHTPSEPSVLHPTAFASFVSLGELQQYSETSEGRIERNRKSPRLYVAERSLSTALQTYKPGWLSVSKGR